MVIMKIGHCDCVHTVILEQNEAKVYNLSSLRLRWYIIRYDADLRVTRNISRRVEIVTDSN